MQLQQIIFYIFATICLSARGCRLNIEPRTLTTTSSSEGQFSAACSCIGAAEDSYYYTWYRHGQLLMTTDKVRLELNRSHRIIFRGIDVTDEGDYVCVATLRDTSISSNSTLTVYCKFTFLFIIYLRICHNETQDKTSDIIRRTYLVIYLDGCI